MFPDKHPWRTSFNGKRRKKTPPRRPKPKSKARRVFVTLEVETDAPLSKLRRASVWNWDQWCGMDLRCLQAQANVAQKA